MLAKTIFSYREFFNSVPEVFQRHHNEQKNDRNETSLYLRQHEKAEWMKDQ